MKTCKLCQKEFKKLAKAHLIPKFVYLRTGLIRDNIGGMFDFKYGRIIKRPKGEYDDDLLCVECDGLMNKRYENYALRLLYPRLGEAKQFSMQRFEHPVEGSVLLYQDIDYHKLKSYLVLNLWRCAVTTRPFFNRVSLNEEDQELIRRKLYNNEIFEENEFVISLHSYEYSDNIPPIISQPGTFNGNGHIFLIGKTIYMYYRNLEVAPKNMDIYNPNKKGQFAIQMIPDIRAKELINLYYNKTLFN